MNRLYHLTRVSIVLLVLVSGCNFDISGDVTGNPQPIITCVNVYGSASNGSGGSPGSSGCITPIGPYSPPEITLSFTQVTSAVAATNGGVASISGQGTESQTPGSYYPGTADPGSNVDPGDIVDPSVNDGATGTVTTGPSGTAPILLEFDTSIDASACETLAQQAIQNGGTLTITGQGSAGTNLQGSPPINCPDNADCSPPSVPAQGWTVILDELDTCALSAPSTPTASPNWVVHFSLVTQANPPFVCPPNTECAQPDDCLAGVPNCGKTNGASIIGEARVQVITTNAGTTTVTSPSSDPLETTIDYAVANDSTNCLAIAAKAIADGRGLTVTGLGTAQVYGMMTGCEPVGPTAACPPAVLDALVTATQILTCTEDAPTPASTTPIGD